MMRYGYFDSEIIGTDPEGMPIFDRAETSDLFRLLFAKLVSNGVLASPGDCFQVIASEGLNVTVRPGFGMINGAFAYDDAENTLVLDKAPALYSRIDRIVLRCNYADRLCELVVKTGAVANNPVAPEIVQPAAGDYYELGLATIVVGSNVTAISQANITDTRMDSSVCGYITQLIDHIDTKVFYDQFNSFYAEFVEKSNASYDKFNEMAEIAFNGFTAAIDEYIAGLQEKGDADLLAITESFKEFQKTQQNAFNQWFADIKGQLDSDAAGHLQNQADEHEDRLTALENILGGSGAGFHNAIYRGKYLGDKLTDEQSATIRAGKFDDLYIGDYWTIGGVNYRIADFDYFLRSGDTECTQHHAMIVPDSILYKARMNTSNVTTGAYVGSEMYTANLAAAKTTIRNAFGTTHILGHREFLKNAVTNGYESGGSWYDSDIELMTEQMVYGAPIFSNSIAGTAYAAKQTVACKQLNLFRHRPDLIGNRVAYWLRDVVDATSFAFITSAGFCALAGASGSSGVRPAFPIY